MLPPTATKSGQMNPKVGLSIRSDLTGLQEPPAAEVVQSFETLTLYRTAVTIRTTRSKIQKFYFPRPPPPALPLYFHAFL